MFFNDINTHGTNAKLTLPYLKMAQSTDSTKPSHWTFWKKNCLYMNCLLGMLAGYVRDLNKSDMGLYVYRAYSLRH